VRPTSRKSAPTPISLLLGNRLPGLLILLLAAACGETGVETGGPVEIRLEVTEPTRNLGSEHTFRVEARGRFLLGAILDFGDQQADSAAAFGAQSLASVFTHTYAEPGTYRVLAIAEDGTGEVARDSTTVEVLPPP